MKASKSKKISGGHDGYGTLDNQANAHHANGGSRIRSQTSDRFLRFRAYLVVLGGFLVLNSVGALYAFGNIVPYLTSYWTYMHFDGSISDCNSQQVLDKYTSYTDLSVWTYTTFIICFSGLGFMGGYFELCFGPRKTCLVGALATAAALIGTYFTCASFYLTTVTFGALLGACCAVCYTPPIVAVLRWWPHNRAFATSVILLGCSSGAVWMDYVETLFTNPNNLQEDPDNGFLCHGDIMDRFPKVFILLGCLMLGIMGIGAALMANPPAGYALSSKKNGSTNTGAHASGATMHGTVGTGGSKLVQTLVTHLQNSNAGSMPGSMPSSIAASTAPSSAPSTAPSSVACREGDSLSVDVSSLMGANMDQQDQNGNNDEEDEKGKSALLGSMSSREPLRVLIPVTSENNATNTNEKETHKQKQTGNVNDGWKVSLIDEMVASAPRMEDAYPSDNKKEREKQKQFLKKKTKTKSKMYLPQTKGQIVCFLEDNIAEFAYSKKEALLSWKFFHICLIDFLNVVIISFVVSEWKIFANNYLGITDDSFLVLLGSCSSIFNAIGRLAFAWLFDYSKSFRISMASVTLMMTIFVSTICIADLGYSEELLFVWVCALSACAGGNYALYASAVSKSFGIKNAGIILGVLYVVEVPASVGQALLFDNIQGIVGSWLHLSIIMGIGAGVSTLLALAFDTNNSKKIEFLKHHNVWHLAK